MCKGYGSETPERRAFPRDAGAAAVEFAIILPLFLILIGGIIDFGRLFYAEIIVANASREGARMLAMGYSEQQAFDRASAASPNMDVFGGLVLSIPPRPCPADPQPEDSSQYTASVSFDWIIIDAFAPFGSPTPQSIAEMRCRG